MSNKILFNDSHIHFQRKELVQIKTELEKTNSWNIITRDNEFENINSKNIVLGIDPMYVLQLDSIKIRDLKNKIENQIIHLKSKCKLVAIGETGIHKIKGVSIENQIDILNWHFEIALNLNIPLILHVVHAYEEIFHWLLKKPKLKIIWHGAFMNRQIYNQFKRFDILFGLGPNQNHEDTFLVEILNDQKYLLETDCPQKNKTLNWNEYLSIQENFLNKLEKFKNKKEIIHIHEENLNFYS